MATILAINGGNWSNTSTWTGGIIPVAGDVAVANNRNISIDQNVTVAELRNDTTGGATAGGAFYLTNGITVNANVYSGTNNFNSGCVIWSGTAGQSVTLTGIFQAGNGTSSHAVYVSNSGNMVCGIGSQAIGGTINGPSGLVWTSGGTLVFNGSATGGASSNGNCYGIQNTSGTVTIYGNITGGSISNNPGLLANGPSTTVVGNITATGTSYGCSCASVGGVLNITGTITGGANSSYPALLINGGTGSTITITGDAYGAIGSAVYLQSTNTVNHTGNVYSGNGGGNAIVVTTSSSSVYNLTGNVYCQSTASGAAISVSSSATVNIAGSATAGILANAITTNTASTIRLVRAIGNGYGLGSVGINNTVAITSSSASSLNYVEQLQFGSLGNAPVSGPIRLTANTGNVVQFTTTAGTTKTLVDTAATSGVLPATSDVRSGVVYSSGNLTGTCAVPSASVVTLGVPVDNTTGTAILNASNIRTAVGMASANLDSQLKDLNNNTIAAGVLV